MKNGLIASGMILIALVLMAITPVLGQATPESATVFVGPILVDCEGVAPQKCLLVRDNPDEPYRLFYDQIEGFDFREGREYELRVAVEEIENPPADASNLRWRLIEVVNSALSLEGNRWKVDNYLSSTGQMVTALPGASIRVEFRDSQLTGNAGCNNYFGSYAVEGNNIQISDQLGMTGRLCHPEEVMQQERDFLAALAGSRSFSIENEQLQLSDANGNALANLSILKPASLVGTSWTVIRYNNGRGGVKSVIRDTEITAVFAEDGTVSGLAGCNNYSTSYEVTGDAITISDLFAVTQKLCPQPEGIDQQERDYLAALQRAATFDIRDDQLEISDSDGQRQITYQVKTDIVGSEWQWQLLQALDGDSTAVPDPARYTLTLSPDGTAQIQADCNSAGGTYTISGNQISIEIENMTQALCAPESLSDQFLLNLGQIEFYQATDNVLFLSPGANGGIMVFSKK